MGRLDGQVAVVTGAGRGLGRAYARALCAEGAAVVVNDRDKEPADQVVEEIRAGGGTATASYTPVGDHAGAVEIVATALDAFGRLDVMITNAGAARGGPLLDLTPEDWELTIQSHLFGSIHCSVEAARAMAGRDEGGAIVNICSPVFFSGLAELGPYAVAKGGIFSLTKTLAAELAPKGISVNAVAPPATRTGAFLQYFESLRDGGAPQELLDQLLAGSVEPEDVAPLTVFLATAPGRRVSGRVLMLTRDRLVLLSVTPADAAHPAGGPWSVDELIDAVPRLLG